MTVFYANPYIRNQTNLEHHQQSSTDTAAPQGVWQRYSTGKYCRECETSELKYGTNEVFKLSEVGPLSGRTTERKKIRQGLRSREA